jgi:hypothetical protein
MANHSQVKVFVMTIGCLLTVGGLLLLVGNQREILSISIPLTVFVILAGIVLLLIGRSLRTSTTGRARPVTTLLSHQVHVGLAEPKEQKEPPAGRIESLVEASVQRSSFTITRLRSNLLVKCLSNQKQVERLIEFERRRSPSASEEQLLQLAIDRWESDNK